MLEVQALKLPYSLNTVAIRFKVVNNNKFDTVPQLAGGQKLSEGLLSFYQSVLFLDFFLGFLTT